jgi:hypothetical protein
MGRATIVILGACLAVPVATSPAAAEGFRCPSSGRFVEVGDSTAKVERSCGPPKQREDECTENGYCFTAKIGERWVYDFGAAYFVRYLLFLDGKLSQIADGDYGEQRQRRGTHRLCDEGPRRGATNLYGCPSACLRRARAVARLYRACTSCAAAVVRATCESPSSMTLPTPAW